MRLSNLAGAVAVSVLLEPAVAWPGMNSALDELRARQDAPGADGGDSTELIGDLITLQDSELTTVGRSVKNIILGHESGETTDIYTTALPGKNTPACKADPCCIWRYVAQDMYIKFQGKAGRCNGMARASVRLGFHDAAGWSKNTGPLGGADGSLVLAPDEITRPENNGLQDIIKQINKWSNTYGSYGVGVADLIQMAATVATVTCPLGPRIRSFVGRVDSSVAATHDLLPGVNSDANTLIQLFQDKTISPHGLTALIGAHTTSQQEFVDPSRAGDPQDGTPGVWDVKFYSQTLGPAPPRVFRFQSDIVLAQDPRISTEFQKFAVDQSHWNEDYAREYVRLSLLGVFKINKLTECSKVLPPRTMTFKNVDQQLLDKWLNSTENNQAVSDAVLNGDVLDTVKSIIDALKKKIAQKFNA